MINERQAKRYCKEDISKIKNYDKAIADASQTWDLHHMTETWWNCSMKDLIENECYYNRKACELIFLTHDEHISLHNQGKRHSEEARRKISESLKGEKNPFYGKHHSEEARRKMSEAHKGISAWNKGRTASIEARDKMSKSHKGKKLSEEHRKKIADAAKKRWENKKETNLCH